MAQPDVSQMYLLPAVEIGRGRGGTVRTGPGLQGGGRRPLDWRDGLGGAAQAADLLVGDGTPRVGVLLPAPKSRENGDRLEDLLESCRFGESSDRFEGDGLITPPEVSPNCVLMSRHKLSLISW